MTGLQPGQRYSFRVVAMNGVSDTVRETRSDPKTVRTGEGAVLFIRCVNISNVSSRPRICSLCGTQKFSYHPLPLNIVAGYVLILLNFESKEKTSRGRGIKLLTGLNFECLHCKTSV